MTTPRPDLADIRRDYQVADDAMVSYRPRLGGAVDIPFTEGRTMTRTEGELLDGLTRRHGLLGLRNFAGLADTAFSQADSRYPNQPVPAGVPADRAREWQGNDGHRDAFRHAYWNALMTRDYGRGWTSTFATAHEGVPGNWANREAMDLYNNAVGRSIAVDHPDASRERLADLVGAAVRDGRLVVMDRSGRLAWSDGVSLGQHGLSPDDVIGPRLPTPNTQSSNTPATPAERTALVPGADPAMAAMFNSPVYLQAAAALDAQAMNPLDAHVVYRNAQAAGLANVQRISAGQVVVDANGEPTRNVFAFGDRQPGVAGRDYAVVTQAEFNAVTPRDAAQATFAQQQQRDDALVLAQQPTPQRNPLIGV